MTSLCDLPLTAAIDGLAAKEFSAVELTQAYLDRIEQELRLNAFITEMPEQALAQAEKSDAKIAGGDAGPLEGVPLAIKDLFCVEGANTTAGSKILHNFAPTYESTVTKQLWQAGAVCLGKTNLDEFAMGSANITSHFGPVKNPWRDPDMNPPLVPGGSSGGSAAAVSARLCAAATGTDTGGSIRQPASFAGVVGLKPTYGRCSRFGIVAFASSLDQAGPMARSVEDCAVLLQHMAGYDPKDSTSADIPLPDYRSALAEKPTKLRIGIPQEYRMEGMPGEIEDLWQQGIAWLKDFGAEIVDVSLPHTKYALPAYYIIGPAEASSNLARYDGMRFGFRREGADLIDTYEQTRHDGFGAEVKRRVLIGSYVLSAGYFDAYYLKAQRVRRRIIEDFKSVFDRVDLLLTPTSPSSAFAIGERMDDPVAMYLNDVFTVPANLAGLPGISVPAGLSSEGLPLGLQIIGPAWSEATILQCGGIIEQCAQFDTFPNGLR